MTNRTPFELPARHDGLRATVIIALVALLTSSFIATAMRPVAPAPMPAPQEQARVAKPVPPAAG